MDASSKYNFMIVCFSFNVITPDTPPNIALRLFSIKNGSVFNCYGGSLLSYHIQIVLKNRLVYSKRGVNKSRYDRVKA